MKALYRSNKRLIVTVLYTCCLQDFTSDFYFRQRWRDERLSFGALPALESMTVGAEVAEKIWVPDTFFANEKSAYFHTATTPNTFLRISHNGDVLRSIRYVIKQRNLHVSWRAIVGVTTITNKICLHSQATDTSIVLNFHCDRQTT